MKAKEFLNRIPEKKDPFEIAFEKFLKGAQKIVDDYWKRSGFRPLMKPTLVPQRGRRYIRIVSKDPSSGSAWAFIDITNGDVLKPAGFRTPARHARGNIYDQWNGLKAVSAYGPAYLR